MLKEKWEKNFNFNGREKQRKLYNRISCQLPEQFSLKNCTRERKKKLFNQLIDLICEMHKKLLSTAFISAFLFSFFWFFPLFAFYFNLFKLFYILLFAKEQKNVKQEKFKEDIPSLFLFALSRFHLTRGSGVH